MKIGDFKYRNDHEKSMAMISIMYNTMLSLRSFGVNIPTAIPIVKPPLDLVPLAASRGKFAQYTKYSSPLETNHFISFHYCLSGNSSPDRKSQRDGLLQSSTR